MSRSVHDDITCLNCRETMVPALEREDGECVFWCKLCGTLLQTNLYDPIETDGFCIPSVTDERPDLAGITKRSPVTYYAPKPAVKEDDHALRPTA